MHSPSWLEGAIPYHRDALEHQIRENAMLGLASLLRYWVLTVPLNDKLATDEIQTWADIAITFVREFRKEVDTEEIAHACYILFLRRLPHLRWSSETPVLESSGRLRVPPKWHRAIVHAYTYVLSSITIQLDTRV